MNFFIPLLTIPVSDGLLFAIVIVIIMAVITAQGDLTVTTCCLCGTSDNIHACGEDFLCNNCCNTHMAMENIAEFKWVEKIIAHSIKMKRLANKK